MSSIIAKYPHVIIYTDGSCEPNPGPGGWAVLLRYGSQEKVLTGDELQTTNNRMELTAALKALEALKQPSRIDFHTDSEYLRRGITDWLPEWRGRNWKRKTGKLANLDLWQALDEAVNRHQIEWHWVRGHAGDGDNQRVDRLARMAARQAVRRVTSQAERSDQRLNDNQNLDV